jgi:serine/threonine protein kinase
MRIVDGRYVLTNDPFREGGMSTVAKAFDPINSRFCAIKRMKGSGGEDICWKESFNREYAALSELSQHQNIVARLDAGTDDVFMVLEWVSENLVDRISAGGPLNWHDFYHTIDGAQRCGAAR